MYTQKIEQASLVLLEHCKAMGEQEPQKAVDDFINKLKVAGGTSDEALQECSWGDLERIGLPPLLTKRIAKIFRGKEKGEPETKANTVVVTTRRASVMTARELLECYDPRDPENAVGKRLSELSGGKRCIVYNADGTVNVEASTTLIQWIRDGVQEQTSFIVDGQAGLTYAIGQKPDALADENPLYPGEMLLPNGTCLHTGADWTGVDPKIRQFVYLAVTCGDIRIAKLDDAHAVLDVVLGDDAFTKLMRRYKNASIEFQKLAQSGDLPKLKVRMNQVNLGRGINNPFGGHRSF